MKATYIDAKTFTVKGDFASEFTKGRRLRCDCTTDGWSLCTVLASCYDADHTTVRLTVASDSLTRNLATAIWSENTTPYSEQTIAQLAEELGLTDKKKKTREINTATRYALAERALALLSLILAAIFFGWQGTLVCFVLLFYVNVRSTRRAAQMVVIASMAGREEAK